MVRAHAAMSGGARAALLSLLLSAAACSGSASAPQAAARCDGESAQFATRVVAVEFGPGQDFGQDRFPAAVLGPPRGGGCCAGSTDVTSLGDGGSVVLELGADIVDGPGADFIVFENAFVPQDAGDEEVYAELGRVSVSADGETWSSYECSARTYPYGDCAGWRPVLADETTPVDVHDSAAAGGDAFDLATLGVSSARYVKIEDVPEADGGVGTFDLDAVAVVNMDCP